jgi:RimJ/RimL family protein N-acetyltransferase
MQTLHTASLTLEPLTVAHADEMYGVLAEARLYEHLDYGPPPSLEHVRSVYARQAPGRSPDGRQLWLNWLLRLNGAGLIGYVQATVTPAADAWVAYVLASAHWGQGHASAASAAMIEHLRQAHGCRRCLASVELANHRSVAVLKRLGFHQAEGAELKGHELSPTELLFIRHLAGATGDQPRGTAS